MRTVRIQRVSPDETVLRAGQIIDGKYRVESPLGQGGMAAVWAGTNEHTGKRFALKAILPSLASTREAQQLLHSEALAASRVDHPNVVTVFDVIKHEGMTCMVMELLEGEPLDAYLARNGFIKVDEISTLLLPVMRGMAAAHSQGVIHLDLKPQNVFICVDPDGRIVTTKVLDFGISVMVGRVLDAPASVVEQAMLGTPTYMSPEHISGVARLDERTDVYGFGVLLYEALTGHIPFPGDPGPALFDRILHQPAPSVTLFRSDLPPGLVHIIEKAMSKERAQRYASLDSMVSALEHELPPPKPPLRGHTPVAGVPAVAQHQYLGPHLEPALPAAVNGARSLQETKLLFGAPLELERVDSTLAGKNSGTFHDVWGEESESESAETATGARNEDWGITVRVRGPDSATKVLHWRRLLRRKTSGSTWLSRLRGWPALLGAGSAMVLVLVVWVTLREARPVQAAGPVSVAHSTPPAGEAAAPHAVSVPIAQVGRAAGSVDLLTCPSLPAPASRATPPSSSPNGYSHAVRAPFGRSRVAPKKIPTDLPSPLGNASPVHEPTPTALPMPASPRAAPPGAGRLSIEDF